jgi:hypothetical protein
MPGALSDRLLRSIGFICKACSKSLHHPLRLIGTVSVDTCAAHRARHIMLVLDDGSTRRQLVPQNDHTCTQLLLRTLKEQALLGKLGVGNPYS